MKNRSTYGLVAVAIALFAAGTAVHIACGDFPKGIDVLPDERRYLDIARSLFAGEGLIIRGVESSFQKILYPLLISPALLFPDGDAQIRFVNVLNSIYACSTVFPALAIARKLFEHPIAIIGCMAVAMVAPDLMYSMTFMTESVFMPLALWLVYLCWRCFESGGISELALAAAAGALCYVTYLCKEVAWMFLIAFAAVYLVAAVRKRRTVKRTIAVLGLCATGYFAPFIIMKLTLFSGLFNSYGQFSFDILLSQYTVMFALYSTAVDATYFIVGFGVFPVLYVACAYRELTREERDLALFCLVSLLVGLACVVFTISMREDVGHVALRQHLRYVAPLALPLLFLFVKQGARLNPVCIMTDPRRRAWLVGVTVAFCGLVVAFFGTANLSQGFDNSQFHFMRWMLDQGNVLAQDRFDSWAQVMKPIDTDDGDLLAIAPLNWLCRFAVVAFTAIGMGMLMSRRKVRRIGLAAVTVVIVAFMAANSVAAYHYNRHAYEVEQGKIDEICAISDQLAEREGGGEVVIVLDEANTGPNNLIDTYLQDGAGDYRYIEVKELNDYLYPDSGDGDLRDSVEYVLANSKQRIDKIAEDAEVIGGNADDGGNFRLYRATRQASEADAAANPASPSGAIQKLADRVLADS